MLLLRRRGGVGSWRNTRSVRKKTNIGEVEFSTLAVKNRIHAELLRLARDNLTAKNQGSIAPYLRLSPPAFPVSISVKGAFLSEYADYGYSIGGASDFVTRTGFTVSAATR